MTLVPQPEVIDWDELETIRVESYRAGLALFFNDFSAPIAQHNSLGGPNQHAFGLVLSVQEEEAIQTQREKTGIYQDLLLHPRTRWAATPKLALLASLALFERKPTDS